MVGRLFSQLRLVFERDTHEVGPMELFSIDTAIILAAETGIWDYISKTLELYFKLFNYFSKTFEPNFETLEVEPYFKPVNQFSKPLNHISNP